MGTKFKSFDELNRFAQEEDEKQRETEKQLYERQALVADICLKVETLKNAGNGVLEGTVSYKGKSAVFQEVFGCKKAQVSNILEAILKYVHSNRQDIRELKYINKVLNHLVRKSENRDEIAKEIEQDRMQKEAEKLRLKKAEEERRRKELEEERIKRIAEIKTLEEALIVRNITTLFHFTRIENLCSILQKGIIPREELIVSGAEYVYNDYHRMDGMLNCSCVSIEFPNTWLLRKKISDNPGSKWALIELDANLLLKQKNYYAEHNAATYSVKCNLKEKTSVKAFENMFANPVHIEKSDGSAETYTRNGLGYNLPTSDQAEILVEGIISNGFIKKVYFQDWKSMHEKESQMRKLGIEFNVWPELFRGYRKDFSGVI